MQGLALTVNRLNGVYQSQKKRKLTRGWKMKKLDQEKVKENSGFGKESIPFHQVAVYVMCGGGFLGSFAAEQPADFYIDDRMGKLPYKKDEIYQAVRTLVTIAEKSGLDPHSMPRMNGFHNCGIF